ncbi:MAG TPA: hypothetical protein PLI27_08090 [Ignavibacteriales bacterium]|nr:hypothetical protein [Ignavibacteriales bacterium]HOL80635.1 hypothetical protein [Ignavibacteriales bacterium]HOM64323.1 hypothetical protein [Ignavibacteriales bacterium]HPD68017.1 hypothetical protein [Ignavibacteriales bacterium]HPP33031.1 hypothetical protein [Ignavibacteriales bacterium]
MQLLNYQTYGNPNAINKLNEIINGTRIPHAMLFIGPEGTGKFYYALNFALSINANVDNNIYNLIKNLSEPYIKFIFPVPSAKEDIDDNSTNAEYIQDYFSHKAINPFYKNLTNPGKVITIDTIRELNNFAYLLVSEVKYRVIIIEDAHLLSSNAQQSLLKILEEPPEGIIFILLSSQPNLLLDTIKSRCQIINFAKLSNDNLKNILSHYYDINQLNDDILTISEGQYTNYLFYKNEDTSYIKNKIIEFLRATVTKKFFSAHSICKSFYEKNSKDFLTFLKFLVFWFYEAYNYANKKEIKLYKDYLNTIGNFTNKYDDKEFVKIVLNLEKFFQNINSNINLNILSINLILELSQIKTKG